ncbi:MAG TPA: hypothetical protein VMY37_26935 [Thermoguttaceae bacterium]|nr:hypothetical protein [Thermoguttaceae bacterium]
MGHSFVEFRGQSALIHDLGIENTVALMKEESRRLFSADDYPVALAEQFEAWQYAIENCGVGCIQIDVDRFLSDDEMIELNLRIIDSVEATIRAFGEAVPRSYLQRVVGGRYSKDVPTQVVLRDLRKFREVIVSGTNRT